MEGPVELDRISKIPPPFVPGGANATGSKFNWAVTGDGLLVAIVVTLEACSDTAKSSVPITAAPTLDRALESIKLLRARVYAFDPGINIGLP